MTQQDKLIKQLYRLTVLLADDVDHLLCHVHEHGPHKPNTRNQSRVAQRVVVLRANVEKLKSIADSSVSVLSGKAK